KDEMQKSILQLPSWVLNPTSSEGITAVGMAGYSKHGLRVMKPQAEMDARAKLAGQIQTVVSRMQKQAIRYSQVANSDEMENLFSQTTKEVIEKTPLSGAVIVNQAMVANGDYYVQMVIKNHELAQQLEAQKESYKKSMEDAQMSRENIRDGMEILDSMIKELDKEQ
ncbi:MAG: LPP20 family lipoprotein, partial [Campylobacterales bacterium]|nr:LPP20 family lipoprotein [Campylobacterales bacterium]